MLLADLSRALFRSHMSAFEVDFIGVESYGKSVQSSRNPKITKELCAEVANRNVLLVEDIVDTGWTLHFLIEHVKRSKPASLKTLILLSKPARREVDVKLDYVGFEIENVWVEGYGLDSAGSGRGCPDIVVRE